MIKIKLVTTIALFTLSISNSQASETSYGLGASIGNTLKIYLPITTDQYLIEPSILIYSNNGKEIEDSSIDSDDFDVIEFDIGLFKKQLAFENTYIYYGARIGYIKTESKSTFGSSTYESKEDGYTIAPTFGSEYVLSNNFSVGIELSIKYDGTDGKRTSESQFSSTSIDLEETEYKTQAGIIARYRF